ncbi:MAG: dephospho-CoA kinase [Gammaproteobacteria bacterium]|nr:dephospho-CoA kinase [Gammaproteobacteria bacterium]
MAVIALTGGICSGKSMVTQILQEYVPIIDADIIARNLLSEAYDKSYISNNAIPHHSQKAIHEVVNCFGMNILTDDKFLNRKELRELVFHPNKQTAKENKSQLEAILHPLVYQEIWLQADKLKHDNTHIIVAIPLLRETLTDAEIKDNFDQVWVIDCDQKKQIERCLQRDNCNKETIQQMIDLQASREDRLKIADVVINNNGSREELRECIYKNYQTLIANTLITNK